jgi:hypothetical protein
MSLSREGRATLIRELHVESLPGQIEREVRGELRGLLNQYLSHLVGHRPKMQSFFGLLMSG